MSSRDPARTLPSSLDAINECSDITDRSDRVSYGAADHAFSVLRRQLGWTAVGRTRKPRIHDLRHRMVVRRFQTWHTQDVNVDAKIVVLATYMGHMEVRNLYWYFSSVPELDRRGLAWAHWPSGDQVA